MSHSMMLDSASHAASSAAASFLIKDILEVHRGTGQAGASAQSSLYSHHHHTVASLTALGNHLLPSAAAATTTHVARFVTTNPVALAAPFHPLFFGRYQEMPTCLPGNWLHSASDIPTLVSGLHDASISHLDNGLDAGAETDSTGRVESELESGVSSKNTRSGNESKNNGSSGNGSKCHLKTQSGQRKARTAFTGHQLETLETSFQRQKYLSVQDRMKLASKLNLSDIQVKTWYQNRRTKWKRQTAVGMELLAEAGNFAAVQRIIQDNPFWLSHLSQFPLNADSIPSVCWEQELQRLPQDQDHGSCSL